MTKAVTLSNGTIMFPVARTRPPSLQSVRYVGNVVSLPSADAPTSCARADGDAGQPAECGRADVDLSLPGNR